MLLRLFQTSRRFNIEVQPQLVLLQKTLLNIEGLGRELDPDLDLWATAKPFLERWMSEQVGWRGLMRNLRDRGAVLGHHAAADCRAWCTAVSNDDRGTPDAGAARSACSSSSAHQTRLLLALTGLLAVMLALLLFG